VVGVGLYFTKLKQQLFKEFDVFVVCL